MAAAGQFSWPPAGSYLTVYGQFLVAAVTGPHLTRSRRAFSASLTTTVFS